MDNLILADKYKSVLKKVRTVNEPITKDLNPPLERPPLSRDPYETPLSPSPPIFQETFQDAGLPPYIEEFVDEFSERACYGLGDILGGYDERELDVSTRPLTTFETPLGRLKLTRLSQGATNSGAVYQAQMNWILQEEIPESVEIFIEDGGIKGPRSLYNQETLPEKPSISRRLIRENIDWDWDKKCEEAFHKLRGIVGEEIALKKLDYDKGEGEIKLAVDSSYIAAGAVLTQEDKEGKYRPVLYESITFSKLESKYSQPKLEICEFARILKKLQTIIWGQNFELQANAKALIEMINTPCLPNAPMTRWVPFIQLSSFDLVQKPGKTSTMPDGLSRRPKTSEEEDGDAPEFDEEED
ncbi:hypothetical protein O181_066420 [Austropuccinia psidii MF-1]|uniref:Reverse transcriptase RNase H-like domain-containing protein n=1 Tax=Austropuccinia psidii MF-1 TaxID=1389203 RepID=A0A9Q3I537_9BASI|nr:hypothetical protein [Austropuccinia psidii MF-1]